MTKSQRHLARILVLKSLYAAEHGETTAEETLEVLLESEKLAQKNVNFARDLIKFINSQSEWADQLISSMSENWKFERIAAVDRIILKMALVELKMIVDTPEKVVINEAIELGKEFSTLESSRFINGILDRFINKTDKSDKPEQ